MADLRPTHTLYHFSFSICSLYVRYAYALRGIAKNSEHKIRLQEKQIDLRPPALDQLKEDFLVRVNHRGEVPVLVEDAGLQRVLPDSRAITYKLAESYPQLLPRDHEADIRRMLDELHEIEYFSLTFWGKFQYPGGAIGALLEMMARDDISDVHRARLDNKITLVQGREIPALKKSSLDEAIRRTKKFFEGVDQRLGQSGTEWIFNTKNATALDAQTIVFVARLQDVGRAGLIPVRVSSYAEQAMQQPEWKGVMQGYRTIPPGGF